MVNVQVTMIVALPQNANNDAIATFKEAEDATRPGTVMPMRAPYTFTTAGDYTITVQRLLARYSEQCSLTQINHTHHCPMQIVK